MDAVLLERERVLFRLNEEINAKSRGLFELNENASWMSAKRRMRNNLRKTNHHIPLTDGSENTSGDGGNKENDCDRMSPSDTETECNESSHCTEEAKSLESGKESNLSSTAMKEDGQVVKIGEKKINNKAVAKQNTAGSAKSVNKNMADVVPKVLEKKNISSEGLIKFLKSKVAIIQTELETVQKQNDSNVKDLSLALDRMKQLESFKEQLMTKNAALERTVKKYEERNLELDKLVKEKEAQIVNVTKELATARSEIRCISQNNQNLEKKQLKAQEDIDSLKIKLTIANDAEKETRDGARQERLTYEKQIKQLRKQRGEVLADYKKLLLAVDQMKKQNFHLDQTRLMSDFERDYFKHLDDSSEVALSQ
ncbi:dynein regulatory complex protein 1 [Wyeomyia smithii]|uniref:dynein regulatory complex protein 1 n=1 Tax=Wyeomyia smithii TaxID=174621 RepID=UPI002467FBA2|nr:dynein regulatory complex protein 1 [Wyeomyia smithii]